MNKDLKNDFYSLPKELLLHLNDNLKNSNDSQSGFKRLKGMCDQKGMGYTQAKKVKHEMENGMEPQVYKLIGGDELLSWINDMFKLYVSSYGSTNTGTNALSVIARTEATKAVNMATDQAYQTAAQDGINIEKEWLSSEDEDVRDTHVELNGQVVGVNDVFIVPSAPSHKASSPALFPQASENINCRCTIIAKIT